MRTHHILVLGIGLGMAAGACRGTRPPRRLTLPEDGAVVSPPESPAALTRDLRATVLESYGTLRGNYDEAYLDGLAHDARLLLIDVEPDALLVGFDPAAADLRRRLAADSHELVSKALEIHLAADRSVAWTFDELSYRITRGRRRAFVPLRATSVWERHTGRWVLVQGHTSYGVPDDRALEDAAAWPAPPAPTRVPDHRPRTPGAADVRAVLVALIHDEAAARRNNVSLDDDALVVGIGPASEARGAAVDDVPSIRALFGYEFKCMPEGLRVEVSRSGTVAWAAGNVAIQGAHAGRAVALKVRATWVLERRAGHWRVVQSHVSVPVTEDALTAEVLGKPDESRAAHGSGEVPAGLDGRPTLREERP